MLRTSSLQSRDAVGISMDVGSTQKVGWGALAFKGILKSKKGAMCEKWGRGTSPMCPRAPCVHGSHVHGHFKVWSIVANGTLPTSRIFQGESPASLGSPCSVLNFRKLMGI